MSGWLVTVRLATQDRNNQSYKKRSELDPVGSQCLDVETIIEVVL